MEKLQNPFLVGCALEGYRIFSGQEKEIITAQPFEGQFNSVLILKLDTELKLGQSPRTGQAPTSRIKGKSTGDRRHHLCRQGRPDDRLYRAYQKGDSGCRE